MNAEEQERDMYTEVAIRFFNEFLEQKMDIQSGRLVSPKERRKEMDRKDKEIAELKKAVSIMRETAQHLAQRNEALEGEMENMEAKMMDLRRQLNEALIRGQLPDRIAKLNKETPLDQHMSERAFKEWQRILTEIPRPGH